MPCHCTNHIIKQTSLFMRNLIAMPFKASAYSRIVTAIKRSPVTRFTLRWLPLTSAILVSLLFLYAAYYKFVDKNFTWQLQQSPLLIFLPDTYKNPIAKVLTYLVPSLEVLIALTFILKRTRLFAFYAAFYLMLLFTAYVFIIPHFFTGLQTCSCGGIISQLGWRGHFYLNLSFTILTGLALSRFGYIIGLRRKQAAELQAKNKSKTTIINTNQHAKA